MEMELERWVSELEMDEYLINLYPNQSSEFDDYVQLVFTPDENINQSSSESQSSGTTSNRKSVEIYRTNFERSNKQLITDYNAPNTALIIDQANGNVESSLNPNDGQANNKDLDDGNKKNNAPKVGQKRTNAMIRTPSETQDRVMAERKRREKLSQRFIALSAMVPGLKKMDKASVLGDAIKYLKQLQDNMKTLEEKINKKTTESVVFVKKSQMNLDDDVSSCDENFDGHFKEALPEIEARISDKNVLIRIHCEKQKGFAVKLLSEIEKLHLNIVNSSFLPFGQFAVDITVVAEMDDEFNMKVKELVRSLRSAFNTFM